MAVTDALSTANRRPIHCQPTPYPANRRPILPTAALSCQPTPYPANCRHITSRPLIPLPGFSSASAHPAQPRDAKRTPHTPPDQALTSGYCVELHTHPRNARNATPNATPTIDTTHPKTHPHPHPTPPKA
ncbi:hypothetical protein T484DRAFT_3632584 [Baffinella frigidus]|nr:hypothetical protein T484DRAFT_3632584 [Cryptophyta sp. CCMP2293]